MNAKPGLVLLLASLVLPATADACGEGMFSTGRGLPYRAYVAPRPAAVLVYATPHEHGAPAGDQPLYAGLQRAGHRVTVVEDPAALQQALRERPYDVVIAAFDAMDAVIVADGAKAPALLPVVPRGARDAAAAKGRFEQFVVDGASLGQYLRAIHRLLDPR